MKKIILSSLFLFLTSILYGKQDTIGSSDQDNLKNKSQIKISVAPTVDNALYYQSVQGGAGRNLKPGFSTSFECLFRSDKKINLGFGLSYQFAQVEYTPNMNTGDFTGQIDKVSIISFNLSSIYKLKNDFYLSLNPMVNLQLNYNTYFMTDKQSGIGLSLSVGKYFKINNKVRLNFEPKLWIHNIVPFIGENIPLRLSTLGLNLGLVF